MNKNENKFKRSLKILGILGVINLLYLNIFLPLKLSFEQIFLIAIEVVRVCEERGLDVSKLSETQLDEIISLSISSVKQIFKENGFRFIPNLGRSAYAASEMVPLGSFSKAGSSLVRSNPYSSAVRSIIQGNNLVNNICDCIERLAIVCRNFVYELPNSGKVYLASKGAFLILNITSVEYTVFRYTLWACSTAIQVFRFPGPLHTKLPMIISSLIRDCHLQIFEVVRPILNPLINWTKPLVGIFYKLPFIETGLYIPLNRVLNWTINKLASARSKIKSVPLLAEMYNWLEATFHVKILVLLNPFRLQFNALDSETRKLLEFALSTYQTESKKFEVGLMLDGPYEKYPVSNLPIVYKTASIVARSLGRSEINISLLVARTGRWVQELDEGLKSMSINERRKFEVFVSRKYMWGDDLTLKGKLFTLFKKAVDRFITRGQL